MQTDNAGLRATHRRRFSSANQLHRHRPWAVVAHQMHLPRVRTRSGNQRHLNASAGLTASTTTTSNQSHGYAMVLSKQRPRVVLTQWRILEAGLQRRRHRDRQKYHYRTATVPVQPQERPGVLGAAPDRTRENIDTFHFLPNLPWGSSVTPFRDHLSVRTLSDLRSTSHPGAIDGSAVDAVSISG